MRPTRRSLSVIFAVAVAALVHGPVVLGRTDPSAIPTEVPPPSLGDQLGALEPFVLVVGGLALCIALGVLIGRVGDRGGLPVGAIPPALAALIGFYFGHQVAIDQARASEYGPALDAAVGVLGAGVLAVTALVLAWIGRAVATRTTPLVKGLLIAAGVVLLATAVGMTSGPPMP